MFEFLFDLPLVISGLLMLVCLCLFAIGGLYAIRRTVLPRLRIQVEDSELSGSLMQSIMVFYGLAVALLAVTVSETYNDVSKLVSEEAALYRDVGGYLGAIRATLQAELRDYTKFIIEEAWPQQQRGEVPKGAWNSWTAFRRP